MGWNRRGSFVPQTWLIVLIVLSFVLAGTGLARAPDASRSIVVKTIPSFALADSTVASDPVPNVGIVGEAPPDRQQVEPTIAVDPRDPSIIVAGAQDLRLRSVGEHRWHGYYRSIDGGNTWTELNPDYVSGQIIYVDGGMVSVL